jgi:hypothetical protein
MIHNLYVALAAILLLPLIPAVILYKFLPSKTDDEVGGETGSVGPIKTLSWKLKGAFAGYFLLVLVGLALQYFVMNSKQQKQIEKCNTALQQTRDSIINLKTQMNTLANPVIDWKVKGLLLNTKDNSRFFYDDGTTKAEPDGSFELIKRSIASQGVAKPPKWICIYNSANGFKIVSLNRDIPHPDIKDLKISFNDSTHEIKIAEPIVINSIVKDSLVAIANFMDKNPNFKKQLEIAQPQFFEKVEIFKKENEVAKLKAMDFDKKVKAIQRRTN